MSTVIGQNSFNSLANSVIVPTDALAIDCDQTLQGNHELRHHTQIQYHWIQLLSDITNTTNEASTINQAILASLDAVRSYTGWVFGHCYVRRDDGRELIGTRLLQDEKDIELFTERQAELTNTQIWSCDNPDDFVDLCLKISEKPQHIGDGFIGRACAKGQAAWQLIDDRNAPELNCPLDFAMRYAFPIKAGNIVCGILEFFSLTTQTPDETFLTIMANVGAQLGHAIQRKRLEEKAQLLEEIIRNANDGIVITRADNFNRSGPQIIYTNAAFSSITGYTPEEVIGKTPRMLQGEKTDRATLDRLRHCLENGKSFQGEIINYSKTGDEYWLDLSIVPIRNLNGTVTHFAAIERDLTHRKMVEEELRQAKETAEKAQKKAEDLAQFPLYDPSPLIKFHLDNRKLLYVNPATFNRYSDIFKKGVDHPLLENINEPAQQAFLERRSITREITVGNVTYQQAVTPNLLDNERIVTVYSHDITKLKQTEEILREETVRAEAASRAKSDFLANMSHELRTPMNGVLGMAGLLREAPLEKEQHELVETIFHSGESLLLLLNDILDLSKIEANELTLEEIPFNLPSILHETLRIIEPLATKKGLPIEYSFSPTTPDGVISDPARIRQIVTNLLGNAIKFTEKGHIALNITSRPLSDTKAEVLFSIEDTGIGIAEKALGKIFNKFTQADESTTRRFGGTGLGLTICKLLVEALGGTIGVESTPGKGSRFWFALPLQIASTTQTERLRHENRGTSSQDDVKPDFSAYRLIVVDDHPVNLFFAKKLLLKFGFKTVDSAEDGKTALEMIQRHHYDLVMLDCQMPDMDGYEVCRSIRRAEPISDHRIPVIAMTANAMVGDREKCMDAGMDDYVTKPINSARIMEVLMKWLKENNEKAEQPVASASAPAEAPVDMEHLGQYIGDDPEDKKVVVGLFATGAEESIGIMTAELHNTDSLAWKKAAHKLKGSAANFGANPLRALCLKAEELSEAGVEDKQRILDAIKKANEDINAFFANS